MTYLTLSLECQCGRPASSIQEVGFTNDHQLIMRWRCPKCKKNAYVLKPLNDCWKDCPTDEEIHEGAESTPEMPHVTDQQFLHSLGIRFLDEADISDLSSTGTV